MTKKDILEILEPLDDNSDILACVDNGEGQDVYNLELDCIGKSVVYLLVDRKII